MAVQDIRRKTLRIRRVELDLTQMRTARASGLDINRYWRIENGEVDPTPDEQKAIAKALKAKVADLFSEAVSA